VNGKELECLITFVTLFDVVAEARRRSKGGYVN